MPTVAGVDGCKDGWVYIAHDLARNTLIAGEVRHIRSLLDLSPRPDVVAVDVPIGLAHDCYRTADKDVREQLKHRRNSVFLAPVRATLGADSHAKACALSAAQRPDGKRISIQAYCILEKIKEVDTFIRGDLARQDWLREVHPELSFCLWNGGAPMPHRKKSPEGQRDREALVTKRYGAAYTDVLRQLRGSSAKPDDILDAFAALWSAERIWRKEADVFPATPERDACGLSMEISA